MEVVYKDTAFIGDNQKYNYFYKIINMKNNNYYFGVHSTNNINDNYYGSGLIIKKLYKKYGYSIFKKEILKFFNNDVEMYEYEQMHVNKNIINDENCYNLCVGGKGGRKDTIIVFDENNNKIVITNNNEKYLQGIYKSINVGENNPMYNKQHTKEYKQKMSIFMKEYCKTHKRIMSEEEKEKHKLANINRITIFKYIDNKTKIKRVYEEELNTYLLNGWIKSKGKIYINKNKINKLIGHTKIFNYLNDGWKEGKYIKTKEEISLEKSRSLKEYYKKHPQTIKESVKLKISETLKNRFKDKTNCFNYNKKLMNNGIITKWIDKQDVDEYLNKNWVFGKIK